MSKVPQKIKIPRATTESNRFSLPSKNITTMDFYKLKPVYTRELVPKSSLKMDMGVFSRLSPMVKPVYGDCKIISRGFFVPFRTILDGWNEFITDTFYKGKIVKIPTITNANLVRCFVSDDVVYPAPNDAFADMDEEYWNAYYDTDYLAIRVSRDDITPDFVHWDEGSQVAAYKFTQLGKHVYDVLCSLGYSISFADELEVDATFSLMPFLAYYKLFQDWYRNSAYNYSWPIQFPVTSLTDATLVFNMREALKSFRFAFYERDYFTSAFDYPIQNNDGSNTSVRLNDMSVMETEQSADTLSSTRVDTTGSFGTPSIKASAINTMSITKYLIHGVEVLTDYFKRHQLAGTQAMERFLARFGVQLPDSKLNRTVYLGKSITPIQIADIMNQTASVDGPALGEYAGRGIGSGTGSFEYSTDEYGQFFVVSVVVPDIMYVQGFDRSLMHINRLDFFTPEMEKIGGVQPIMIGELLGKNLAVSFDGDSADLPTDMTQVFGFTSRYAEYKVANNRVTGDFLLGLDDVNSDMNRYHMARLFNPNVSEFHSLAFTRANPQQYNRIFADANGDFDHFINVFYFNVELHQPMARLFDDYEFEEVDSGANVTIQQNGVTLD